MDVQKLYVKHLKLRNGLMSCDEVSHYGHIADVLALDIRKQHIVEYEFKSNSTDLKVLEFRKAKYKPHKEYYKSIMTKNWSSGHLVDRAYREPHRFYFVVPEALYRKEEKYLEGLNCGVVMCFENSRSEIDFVVMKRCTTRKKNLQNYQIAIKNIANRLSNVYVYNYLN